MIQYIKNLISPEIKLTNVEKEVESVVVKLLKKQDTDIIQEPYSTSILIVNERLDSCIEINGSISIVDDNIFRVTPFRLSFIEKMKNLAHKEIAQRYNSNKQRLFNKSLSMLEHMNEKLS